MGALTSVVASRKFRLSAAVAAAALAFQVGSAQAAFIGSNNLGWTQFATGGAGVGGNGIDPNNASIGVGTAMQSAFSKDQPKISGSLIDYQNNRLYVATNVGLDRGNVTVFNATTGAVIQQLNTTGGVSQMVLAGDGKVYGVVNQVADRASTPTATSQLSGQEYRIVKLNTADQNSYSVNTVWRPSDLNATLDNTRTPIVGLGLNPVTRNPVWTITSVGWTTALANASGITKNASGFEYDTNTSTWAQKTTGNTGFSSHRQSYNNGTVVGVDAGNNPVVGYYGGGSSANADSLFFNTTNPSITAGGTISSSSGFVNNAITASTYSYKANNYWQGYSGSSSSAIIALRNGVDTGTDNYTTGVYAGTGSANGAGTTSVFHAPPEGGAVSGSSFMVPTMIPDLAGNIYYSVQANAGQYAAGLGYGKVLQMDSAGSYYDDGVPAIVSGRTGSVLSQEQVVSLTSAPSVDGGLVVFATTLDNTGQYRVYKSAGTIVPEPASVGLLAAAGGLVALRRRRR
jgi:hypothetical protein